MSEVGLRYDRRIDGFGGVNFNLTVTLKLTAGGSCLEGLVHRRKRVGGPQNSECGRHSIERREPRHSRAGIEWQADPNDFYYFTYSKGFRPGGNNPSISYDLGRVARDEKHAYTLYYTDSLARRLPSGRSGHCRRILNF